MASIRFDAHVLCSQRIRVVAKVVTDYTREALPDRVAQQKPPAAGTAPHPVRTGPAPLLLTDMARAQPAASTAAAAASASAAAAPKASTDIILYGAAAAVADVASALSARAAPAGVAAESMDEYRKAEAVTAAAQSSSRAIIARREPARVPEPKWHAPWKLRRVISGHQGWVRAIAIDPGNEWFVTGGADRVIKVSCLEMSCILPPGLQGLHYLVGVGPCHGHPQGDADGAHQFHPWAGCVAPTSLHVFSGR
jgi:pleiotropic regulator 1